MTLRPDPAPPVATRRPSRVPSNVLAAATLCAAFAVADLSGVRALGGVVLVAGGLWCALRSRRAGGWRVAAVVVLAAVLFVASHVLAPTLGAWPAVLLAAAALGVATYALVDRRGAAHEPPHPHPHGVGQPGEVGSTAARASRGMRATEKLVTFFGPAQVGDPTTPLRPVSPAERTREHELQSSLERVVGPDGSVYVVERPGGSAPRPPA